MPVFSVASTWFVVSVAVAASCITVVKLAVAVAPAIAALTKAADIAALDACPFTAAALRAPRLSDIGNLPYTCNCK